MSSLTRDVSDPRALAYVYQQQDAYLLFYIKTANLVMIHIQRIGNNMWLYVRVLYIHWFRTLWGLKSILHLLQLHIHTSVRFVCFHQAEPVLSDIQQVCQAEDQQTQQKLAGVPTQVRKKKKNICFGRRRSAGPLLFPCLWVILFLERCHLFCLQNNSSLFLNHSPTSAAEVGKKHFSLNRFRKPQIIFGVNLVRLNCFSKWERSHPNLPLHPNALLFSEVGIGRYIQPSAGSLQSGMCSRNAMRVIPTQEVTLTEV